MTTSVVKLDIGGRVFRTTAATLIGSGSPIFVAALTKPFTGLPQGFVSYVGEEVFVDRDGDMFAPLLAFLRTGVLKVPAGVAVEDLLQEAAFYGIKIEQGQVQGREWGRFLFNEATSEIVWYSPSGCDSFGQGRRIKAQTMKKAVAFLEEKLMSEGWVVESCGHHGGGVNGAMDSNSVWWILSRAARPDATASLTTINSQTETSGEPSAPRYSAVMSTADTDAARQTTQGGGWEPPPTTKTLYHHGKPYVPKPEPSRGLFGNLRK